MEYMKLQCRMQRPSCSFKTKFVANCKSGVGQGRRARTGQKGEEMAPMAVNKFDGLVWRNKT